MLNLIGFWTGVSIYTGVMLLPLIWLGCLILDEVLRYIMQGDYNKAYDEWDGRYPPGGRFMCIDNKKVLGCSVPDSGLVVLAIMAGVAMWLLTALILQDSRIEASTLWQVAALFGGWVATPFSWVGITAIIVFVAGKGGRWIYRFKKSVDKLVANKE